MNDVSTTIWERFLDTLKGYWYRYVVLVLFLAALGSFWIEWREEQAQAVARLENNYEVVLASQEAWLNAADQVVSASAREGARYPTLDSLFELDAAVRQTLDAVTAVYAPTSRLAESSQAYRDALADVAGAINQYRSDDSSYSRLVNAVQIASNEGGDYRDDVDAYRTNAIQSFLSIIF